MVRFGQIVIEGSVGSLGYWIDIEGLTHSPIGQRKMEHPDRRCALDWQASEGFVVEAQNGRDKPPMRQTT